jgi:hypothetical protein
MDYLFEKFQSMPLCQFELQTLQLLQAVTVQSINNAVLQVDTIHSIIK